MTLEVKQLVCDGNSITAGFIGEGVALPQNAAWPVVIRAQLIADASTTKAWLVTSVAQSGDTTANRITKYDQAVRTQFKPNLGLNVLTFFEGTNDFITDGLSVDAAIVRLKAYASTALFQGWTLQLATIPDTTNASARPKVAQLNAWMRTPEARPFSSLPILDIGADSRLRNAGDLTFFQSDGVHPNDVGYAVIADLFHTRIASL